MDGVMVPFLQNGGAHRPGHGGAVRGDFRHAERQRQIVQEVAGGRHVRGGGDRFADGGCGDGREVWGTSNIFIPNGA